MRVTYADDEPSGLATMLGQLVEQNLARDPSRHRLLRPAVATIASHDAEVAVTLRVAEGSLEVAEGAADEARVRVAADSADLLRLVAAPLLLGLPTPFDPRGRGVLADIARGRVRVGGIVLHLPTVRRLTMLLSAL